MSRQTRSQDAYIIIKNNLENKDYPEHINGRQLSARLGMGYTPVREALARIEEEGIIRKIPDRGYFINHILDTEMVRMYQARECMESYVWRQSAQWADEDIIAAMDQIHQQECKALRESTLRSLYQLDVEFHAVLLRIYGNKEFLKTYHNIREKEYICYENWADLYHAQSVAEHGEMLDAMRRKDQDALLDILRAHLNGVEICLKAKCDRIIG